MCTARSAAAAQPAFTAGPSSFGCARCLLPVWLSTTVSAGSYQICAAYTFVDLSAAQLLPTSPATAELTLCYLYGSGSTVRHLHARGDRHTTLTLLHKQSIPVQQLNATVGCLPRGRTTWLRQFGSCLLQILWTLSCDLYRSLACKVLHMPRSFRRPFSHATLLAFGN